MAPGEAGLVAPVGIVRHQPEVDILRVAAHVRPFEADGERVRHGVRHERLRLVGPVHADLGRREVQPEPAKLCGTQDARGRDLHDIAPSLVFGVPLDCTCRVEPAAQNYLPHAAALPLEVLTGYPLAVSGDTALELHPEVLLGSGAGQRRVGRQRVDALRAPVVAEPRVDQALQEAHAGAHVELAPYGYVSGRERTRIVPREVRLGAVGAPETQLPAAPRDRVRVEDSTRQ